LYGKEMIVIFWTKKGLLNLVVGAHANQGGKYNQESSIGGPKKRWHKLIPEKYTEQELCA
jgi:hypothetical protein